MMSSGLPVIVSQNCGSADFMTEAALDPLDVTAWVQAITAALEPAKHTKMSGQSRETAVRLGIDAMLGRMQALYRGLMP